MSASSEPGASSDPGADAQPDQQSSQAEQGQFLTVAEVAKRMRVSKMTVYRLVHAGELPAARVGRSFRVAERDVHVYLENAYYSAG